VGANREGDGLRRDWRQKSFNWYGSWYVVNLWYVIIIIKHIHKINTTFRYPFYWMVQQEWRFFSLWLPCWIHGSGLCTRIRISQAFCTTQKDPTNLFWWETARSQFKTHFKPKGTNVLAICPCTKCQGDLPTTVLVKELVLPLLTNKVIVLVLRKAAMELHDLTRGASDTFECLDKFVNISGYWSEW